MTFYKHHACAALLTPMVHKLAPMAFTIVAGGIATISSSIQHLIWEPMVLDRKLLMPMLLQHCTVPLQNPPHDHP